METRGACSPWAEGGVVRREGDELARSFLGSNFFSLFFTTGLVSYVERPGNDSALVRAENDDNLLAWRRWTQAGMLRREHVHSGRMELAPPREERANASQFVRKHGVLKGMKVFEDAEELLVESLCDVLDKVCKVPSRALTVPMRVPILSFCNEADFLPTRTACVDWEGFSVELLHQCVVLKTSCSGGSFTPHGLYRVETV